MLLSQNNENDECFQSGRYQSVGYQLDYEYDGFGTESEEGAAPGSSRNGSTSYSGRKHRGSGPVRTLPECCISNLIPISEVLDTATSHPSQREDYASLLIANDADYLRRLLTLFSDLEG